MKIGVKTLAETSGFGATGAAGAVAPCLFVEGGGGSGAEAGRAPTSKLLQICTFLLSIN